jgi:hypothetical protein
MRSAVVAVLGLALLTSPVVGLLAGEQAQAQEAREDRETDRVTFYGSIFGHGLWQPMPMNTIYPEDEENFGTGYLAQCGPTPANPGCEEASWNKVALYSTPGPVEVSSREEFLQEGAWAQLHNERGQLTDIRLDTSESVEATVYFAYSLHAWPRGTANEHGTNCVYPHPTGVPCLWPNWRWHPGAFEDVVMEATLYAADLGEMHANASEPPPVEQRIQNGEARVIANGQWGPETVVNGLPDTPNAIEATIDLGPPRSDAIEQNEDFILSFSSYMQTEGEAYNYGSPLRWYSGEFFPPSLELPVENAITVERVLPHFTQGQLAMISVVSMPWGSYDVDGDDIEFTVEGPDGPVDLDPDRLRTLPIEQSLAHGGHYQPVNKSLVWDYRNADIEPGEYEITVEATNLQGSASHACSASFRLVETEDGLRPRDTEPGLCGEQTIGQGDLQEVVEEATEG